MTREPHDLTPPSNLVRRRLARDVRCEVAELRTRLTEVHLRAEVFLSSGLPAEAHRTLEEQHELLDDFRSRLASVLSDAAVEREAERVLAATPELTRLSAGGPMATVGAVGAAGAAGAAGDDEPAAARVAGGRSTADDSADEIAVDAGAVRSRLGRVADRLPAAMSAAAAGVVALALALAGVTNGGSGTPQVAIDGVRSGDTAHLDGTGDGTDASGRSSAGMTLPDPRLTRLRIERALLARQQSDPDVRWLIRRQRELLARLGDRTPGAAVASLLELESLVKQLLAGATDAELQELERWLQGEAERAKQQAAADEQQETDDESPIGDEPDDAPSEEPSQEPSEDEDGLFDPVGGDEDGDGNPDEPSDAPSDEPSEEPSEDPTPSDGDGDGEAGTTPPNPTEPSDENGDGSSDERDDDGLLGFGGG